MMNKCEKCNVYIKDKTIVCPLCHSVLDVNESEEIELEEDYSMYPDVKIHARKLVYFMRVFLYLSIIAAVVTVVVNYITFQGMRWSVICVAAIIYTDVSLNYWIRKNAGHVSKIMMQMIGAILLDVVIDWIIGYQGWSMNYVTPSIMLLMEGILAVLMIVNHTQWVSYILSQVCMVFLSLIGLVLCMLKVVDFPLLYFLAGGVSVVMLIVMLVIGNNNSVGELRQRFRI